MHTWVKATVIMGLSIAMNIGEWVHRLGHAGRLLEHTPHAIEAGAPPAWMQTISSWSRRAVRSAQTRLRIVAPGVASAQTRLRVVAADD